MSTDKKTVEELRQKLEKEKIILEEELKKFAEKDEKLSGDWDTKYPRLNGIGLEDAASEVEVYSNLLPIEHSLELRLKSIGEAIKKIALGLGKYGKCENCGQEINEERLKISPEAKTCSKCKK